ncbi:MAG TPA: thioredoxin domain-containing protein [Thermoanaerobaculia bacterium]|nr:thioredoxin domain-containing protein [Thermoanaerobaculia bacterium]
MRRDRVVIAAIFVSVLAVGGAGADSVVASVNGRGVTQEEVDGPIAGKLRLLEQQMYVLRKSSADNAIARIVVEQEAAKRGLSVDALRQQLSTAGGTVAETEVEREYLENLAAFASMSPEEARHRIRLDLETNRRITAYRAAVEKLIAAAKIDWSLPEPRLSSAQAAPAAFVRGPSDARVTLTVFSDFGCTFCKQVQPALDHILAAYPEGVKLVYRHFPALTQRRSVEAARAAHCAGAQGRFWPYHDALYAEPRLDRDAVQRAAAAADLDGGVFQSCLAEEASMLAVLSDVEAGKRLGVSGTPTLLVNGAVLPGAFDRTALRSAVERELQRVQLGAAAH